MRGRFLTLCFVLLLFILCAKCKLNLKNSPVEEITDVKELKKILRTKNNVLICFISSQKATVNIVKTYRDAADVVKGVGAMLLVDCSGDGKKLCKKLKVLPETYVIRHYKDGDFHKIYDRKGTVSSIVNFMRDPTGDAPWEEDETAVDVAHIPDIQSLSRLLKKESRPVMVMFYAPWCGFCKQLKPEYTAAATALKSTAVMAAVDVNRPENTIIRAKFNITGFPTLMYFENGNYKFTYDGENKKESLIEFMQNPKPAPPKLKEEDWSESISDVVHLTTDTFETFMQGEASTLIMFYAPWCGHCKKMKPEFEKAAEKLKREQISATLAAVDVTKESALAKKFGVQSYPTVKYFKNGEYKWDTPSIRDAEKIIDYMKDPKKPPPPPPPEPEWSEQPSEVIHLNTDNFKSTLRKKRHALVMFYAPWCGHCKLAKPEFVQAAEESKDNSRLAFAAVDCTKHSSLCKGLGVSGYPTFKYYNYYTRSPVTDYTGDRKLSGFLHFMDDVDGGITDKSPPKEEQVTPKPTSVPPKVEHGKVPPLNVRHPAPSVDNKKMSSSSTSSQSTDTTKPMGQPSSPGESSKPMTIPPPIKEKDRKETIKSATPSMTPSPQTKVFTPTTAEEKIAASPSPQKKEPEKRAAGQPTPGDVKTPDKTKIPPPPPPPPSASGSPPPKKPKSSFIKMWGGVIGADKILHVNDANYKELLKKHNAVLVFFYGSWCSSCKTLTAEYGQAAMKLSPTEGILAACDGTENLKIIDEYNISKLPSLKLFHKGTYITDYNGKSQADDIIKFMKLPPILKKQEL